MNIAARSISEAKLEELSTAGKVKRAEVSASRNGWQITVFQSDKEAMTLTAKRGQPRSFKKLDTLVGYLQERGIAMFTVNASDRQEVAVTARSDTSMRMKAAHAALVEQVNLAREDKRPRVTNAEAFKQIRKLLKERSESLEHA